jgi:phosphoglycolate phosphatase
MPGARETLAALHGRGIQLGICSNKPIAFTHDLVAYLQIAEFLTVVLGPEDVGRLKPAPDILLTALERLKIQPTEALYVGDMVVDIQTARAAGIPVWVVATGSDTAETLDRAGPDRRLVGLEELLSRLR